MLGRSKAIGCLKDSYRIKLTYHILGAKQHEQKRKIMDHKHEEGKGPHKMKGKHTEEQGTRQGANSFEIV